ncbi:hypothetical protein [Bizionia paragorgiae]|uniref:Uncharacterized protein n=1 Tax=Bizionia paragorgiae TaxID=283786 RepID=A0A1H3YP11_BIZPA|nr:hypothetical protein [Bizionia paragorgiae]SEA12752.1 hypothetical protein SAMN04487990_1075 [Bizionia paragorgiae]
MQYKRKNYETEYQKTFFGSIFSGIGKFLKKHSGAIIGGLIGGPIGLLVGSGIQAYLDNLWNKNTIQNTPNDSFPLTPQETTLLDGFISRELSPTLVSIANNIDSSIIAIASKQVYGNDIIVNKINAGLKKISAIKAYAVLIENTGEPNRSKNYTANKVALINYYFDALEKAVIKYAQENIRSTHKMVLSAEKVSEFKKIESFNLHWGNQQVDANIKKYLPESASITIDQSPTVVLNPEIISTDPVLDPVSNDTANTIEATPKKYGLLKKAAIGTGIALVIKQLIK